MDMAAVIGRQSMKSLQLYRQFMDNGALDKLHSMRAFAKVVRARHPQR
jgi:hypothetical protein